MGHRHLKWDEYKNLFGDNLNSGYVKFVTTLLSFRQKFSQSSTEINGKSFGNSILSTYDAIHNFLINATDLICFVENLCQLTVKNSNRFLRVKNTIRKRKQNLISLLTYKRGTWSIVTYLCYDSSIFGCYALNFSRLSSYESDTQ